MKTAMPGNGSIQWNAGGWFGAQIGYSVWILPMVFLLAKGEEALAAGLGLLSFSGINILGLWLWSRRHRIRPYPACNSLLTVAGLSAAGFLIYLDFSGAYQAIEKRYFAFPPQYYLVLLIYPFLLLQFYYLNRKGLVSGT